jgi:UDP-glucose-4-epimerase GalE
MSRDPSPVLVTGGAGYIGSHVCKALRQRGFEPAAFDNLSTGHAELVKWGPLLEGDIRDPGAVSRAIDAVKPVAVIHFAGSAYVGESVFDPAKYYGNNVAGTLVLLEAMTQAGVGRIVFSSTCATYGTPDGMTIAESAPQNPINPYGRSKLMVERMLDDFETAHALKSVCLRYFNACGADPEGETGELHEPEPHLIPRAILAALGEISDFRIFGSDYATPDGSPVRDYIHVSDLATAHVDALIHLLNGAASVKVNLGTGRGYSVKEIVAAVARVTGRPVPHETAARRPGDPAFLVADCTKAKELFGFEPSHSDLETIIATAWRWHERRHNQKSS